MSRRHGRNGRLYAAIASGGTAEPINYINSFAVNSATDRQEVTAFGDTNKQYVTGLPDAQGDWAGFWDDGTAQLYTASQDGVARKTYWYPDISNAPGVYWLTTAFFDFSIDSSVDKGVEIKGSWASATELKKIG